MVTFIGTQKKYKWHLKFCWLSLAKLREWRGRERESTINKLACFFKKQEAEEERESAFNRSSETSSDVVQRESSSREKESEREGVRAVQKRKSEARDTSMIIYNHILNPCLDIIQFESNTLFLIVFFCLFALRDWFFVSRLPSLLFNNVNY